MPHAEQARLRPTPVPAGAAKRHMFSRSGERTHIVFGYHPYWIADSVTAHYRFELLSHLAYFSAEVDAGNGEITSTRDWLTSPVIDRAKAAGVKVHLVVTNFGAGNNRVLLSSPAARDTLIRRLVELLRLRGADGVNIDFEAIPGDQRENLTAFFAGLDAALAIALPDADISAALPAVDWNGAWDAAALARHVDLCFVMCYDYFWSGSSTAGPVAPLQGGTYNVARSLETWLQAGVPKQRMIMGVPYYGYDWPVISDTPQSSTLGSGVARVYSTVTGMLQRYEREWSAVFLTPWFPYEVANWRQVWYDDEESLGFKYDLVKELDIAGAGIWALGYDADRPELWELLADRFTQATGVEEASAVAPLILTVFPQPVRTGGEVSCRFRMPRGDGGELLLRDLLGRVRGRYPVSGSEGNVRISLRGLSPGVYLLQLRVVGMVEAVPLLIAR
ncbi:MAG: hypothetical protein JXA28_06270 [Bacteroidetes bacterium]|nr:hypothetical protein [Bacteroidota bacterium]